MSCCVNMDEENSNDKSVRKLYDWNEDDMEMAVLCFLGEWDISIREAAEKFGVPQSSLRDM